MKKLLAIFSFVLLVCALAGLYLLDYTKSNTSEISDHDSMLEAMGVVYRFNKVHVMTELAEPELIQKIKQALAENPGTSALNLSVSAVGSRVTLSGKAGNKNQIYSAIKTTLQTPGVREVISTVIIDPEIKVAGRGSLL